jgi:Co/Zn/Cd efflux system component
MTPARHHGTEDHGSARHAHCCAHDIDPDTARAFGGTLWIVLGLNAGMFALEAGAGIFAGSVALQADALDFLGDSMTYAVSLAVAGMALRWRSVAAAAKGGAMAMFGLWVLGATMHAAVSGQVPDPRVMGSVGALALAANLASAALLYRFRRGDANMQSVWLCSRNDAVGNLAFLVAASGVFATDTPWPDIAVAAILAALALTGAVRILRLARHELRHGAAYEAAARNRDAREQGQTPVRKRTTPRTNATRATGRT